MSTPSLNPSNSARRPGRGGRGRPGAAALGVVRVDKDFGVEYPNGDGASTEVMATLVRVGGALLDELSRAIDATFGVPQAAITALAVIDGAGEFLTPSQISERMLISGASMTATLDVLERRGWILRVPNPLDRRSVLIQMTQDGQKTIDQALPGIRLVELALMSTLTKAERKSLMDIVGKILGRAATIASEEPIPLKGVRHRPARLKVKAP